MGAASTTELFFLEAKGQTFVSPYHAVIGCLPRVDITSQASLGKAAPVEARASAQGKGAALSH